VTQISGLRTAYLRRVGQNAFEEDGLRGPVLLEWNAGEILEEETPSSARARVELIPEPKCGGMSQVLEWNSPVHGNGNGNTDLLSILPPHNNTLPSQQRLELGLTGPKQMLLLDM
jgi:hypothetical protein